MVCGISNNKNLMNTRLTTNVQDPQVWQIISKNTELKPTTLVRNHIFQRLSLARNYDENTGNKFLAEQHFIHRAFRQCSYCHFRWRLFLVR